MSMRDQIRYLIWKNYSDDVDMNTAIADMIIHALPDMITPLVWKKSKAPLFYTAKTNFGPQYTMRISLSGGAIWSVGAVKGWYSASDEHTAKAAVNAHHRAAIMAAFGVAQ